MTTITIRNRTGDILLKIPRDNLVGAIDIEKGFKLKTRASRPIETLWDATTAVTAYAKGIEHQDTRVDFERHGGEILTLATA